MAGSVSLVAYSLPMWHSSRLVCGLLPLIAPSGGGGGVRGGWQQGGAGLWAFGSLALSAQCGMGIDRSLDVSLLLHCWVL